MCLPETVEKVRATVETEGLPADAPRVDRRTVLLGGLGAALAAAAPGRALAAAAEAAAPARAARLQDLTHVFREGSPVFSFHSPERSTIATLRENGFYSQDWHFHEHSGTHMDAPGHFVAGGRLAPQIRPRELVGIPIVVVDISARAARNPDAVVRVADLVRFERRYGRIPRRALVAMDSGWARKIDNPRAFKGGDEFPNYHFPGFSLEAANWLLANRNVTAIGVDTMSLDPGNSQTFPVHVRWLGDDKYGLENLKNLDRIPPRGATAFVGLIPWERGSGGPCRVIARFGARAARLTG